METLEKRAVTNRKYLHLIKGFNTDRDPKEDGFNIGSLSSVGNNSKTLDGRIDRKGINDEPRSGPSTEVTIPQHGALRTPSEKARDEELGVYT